MQYIRWNPDKNIELRNTRGICFEDVELAILDGSILSVAPYHNQTKYPGQKIFIIPLKGYIYLVPFVETDDYIFLKTIIPSRKAKKEYLQ